MRWLSGTLAPRFRRRALYLSAAAVVVLLMVASLVIFRTCAPAHRVMKTDDEIAQRRGIEVEQVMRLHTDRGLDNETLEHIPDAALGRELFKLDYPQAADSGDVFASPGGEEGRPAADLGPAKPEATRGRGSGPFASGAGFSLLPASMAQSARFAGIDPAGWEALGPTNVAGRTRALVIDPTNTNRMFMGSAGGGVWVTEDGGENYRPVDDQMPSLIITCMAIDTTNPKVVYAGTGEDLFTRPGAQWPRGAGVFKITDGRSWTQLRATDGPDFFYVNSLAVSSDGRVLLVGTKAGLFRITDQDGPPPPKLLSFSVGHVLFDPRDDSKAVASGSDRGEVVFSTDGGVTWQNASHSNVPWDNRVVLTYARANSAVVYASVPINSGEVWRSEDGGQSYAKMDSLNKDRDGNGNTVPANYLGRQGRYSNTIWAGHPINDQMIVVGGIDLWKSDDGGATLDDISSYWATSSVHADQHCIVSDPGFDGVTNKRLFFCNDGGVYKTDDIDTAGNEAHAPLCHRWEKVTRRGYATTQFNGGAGNATTRMIVGGTQDNGTLRLLSGGAPDSWTEVSLYTGDGGFCAFDPERPGVFYGESVYMNIFRSDDGGECVEYINGRLSRKKFGEVLCGVGLGCVLESGRTFKSPPFQISDSMPVPGTNTVQANFIAPFVLDPNDSRRLLAGGRFLWRTDDARALNNEQTGPMWAAIKPESVEKISAIAVTPGNSNTVWVGHDRGEVWKTNRGMSAMAFGSWGRVDDNGPNHLPSRDCTRIVIDPRNPQVVYVAFGGYARDNVWKTTDGGLNWRSVSGALPPVPVLALTVHPDNSDLLYVGTTSGVFASETGGDGWAPVGPANCRVNELFWMNRTLVAATYGRGMFRVDVPL